MPLIINIINECGESLASTHKAPRAIGKRACGHGLIEHVFPALEDQLAARPHCGISREALLHGADPVDAEQLMAPEVRDEALLILGSPLSSAANDSAHAGAQAEDGNAYAAPPALGGLDAATSVPASPCVRRDPTPLAQERSGGVDLGRLD